MFFGINVDSVQAVANPEFQADLKNTLVLQAGIGNPTFTRASIATVIDFEELIKTVKSGEARFEGARRVENLIPTPSNTLTSGNNKTITVTAGTYVFSMGAGASSGVATFSGTSGATGTITQNVSSRTSKSFTLAAGTFIVTASVATLVDLQFEQTSGQTITTIPSEYVSVGVLSAPYHGANVDGVQYFTTQNGNSVNSNVVTEATGAAINEFVLKGYFAEGSRINIIHNSDVLSTQNVTVTAQMYVLSFTGIGSITLSGTGSGTLSGTGANDRVNMLFTPTAGTLTITVSGSVTKAQLEAGKLVSSYIPTAGSNVTRQKDVLSYPTSGNLSLSSDYSLYFESKLYAYGDVWQVGIGSDVDYMPMFRIYKSPTDPSVNFFSNASSIGDAASISMNDSDKLFNTKYAARKTSANMSIFVSGVKGTNGTISTQGSSPTKIEIGMQTNGLQLFGTIKNIKIWQSAISDNDLLDITVPLPVESTSPFPANNSINNSTSVQLKWTSGTYASSHNVYFGTTNTPDFIGNQSGTTYTPSLLADNTTYYWRIDEVNFAGIKTGTLHQFTTHSAITKIDLADKNTFIRGIYMAGEATYTDLDNTARWEAIDADLDDIVAHNFNTIWITHLSTSDMATFSQHAAVRGLSIVAAPNEIQASTGSIRNGNHNTIISSLMSTWGSAPKPIAWALDDESPYTYMNEMSNYIIDWHTYAPTEPVTDVEIPGTDYLNAKGAGFDVLTVDDYPFSSVGADPPYYSGLTIPNIWLNYANNLVASSNHPWMMGQSVQVPCGPYDVGSNGNIVYLTGGSPLQYMPSVNQIKWQAYTSLATGNKGMFYFIYRWPQTAQTGVSACGLPGDATTTTDTGLPASFVFNDRTTTPQFEAAKDAMGWIKENNDLLSTLTLSPTSATEAHETTPVESVGNVVNVFNQTGTGKKYMMVVSGYDHNTDTPIAITLDPSIVRLKSLETGNFLTIADGSTSVSLSPASAEIFEVNAAFATTKAITAFNFDALSPSVTGSVNETNHTVALTVPYGTDVTTLVPTITQTGASISPNTGVAHDFTSPATYTVTAGDATTRDYLVTVTVDAPTPTPTPTPTENIEDAVIDTTTTEIIPNSDQSNPTIDHVVATSTQDTITILWKTDRNTTSIVRYGTDKNLIEKKKDTRKEKTHRIILKGLLPDTKYYFRIKSKDSNGNEDYSRIHSILTQAVPASPPLANETSNQDQTPAENTQDIKDTQNDQTHPTSGNLTPTVCSYTVQSGDTLWSIATKIYKDSTAYTLIIDKNKEKYPNIESKLSIGQELTFGCSDTQSQPNTENKVIIDNSNQQSQSPSKTQPQTEIKTFTWWNPFTWF